MRIGLFTDTYRPSINGIVYTVESTKRYLEKLGHEVYVFCPGGSIRPGSLEEDDHTIRFPSVKGAFYDDYDTSLFFPPLVLSRIKELDLEVIHFFTPGQVGLMGVYAAHKTGAALVAQHCTDVYEFIEHYPRTLPGILALAALLPLIFKTNMKDIRAIAELYRPRRSRSAWGRDVIEKLVTMVYSKCDAVIALSRKSQAQLQSWQREAHYKYEVSLLPNGVNAIPAATTQQVTAFRQQWQIAEDDEVFGFVGRLGAEKNLAILIPTIERVMHARPHARLLFVGDFEYREHLEALARGSSTASRITFTGALPREQLGLAYGTLEVFVFPSLTDTQGWVLHEAAHAGLPIVLIDRQLSEVMVDGENGYFADNNADDLAKVISTLLADGALRDRFGSRSKQLAATFTEGRQIGKLTKLYERAIVAAVHKQQVRDEF